MDSSTAIKLLLRKNFTIECRYWQKSFMEVIILIALLTIILINPIERSYRYELNDETVKGVAFRDKESLERLDAFREELQIKTDKIKLNLAYTPILPGTTRIINEVVQKLKLNKAIGFDNHFVMEAKFKNTTTFAAVEFQHYSKTGPNDLSITIRFPSNFRTVQTDNVKDSIWLTRCNGILSRDNQNTENINTDLYLREGFLQLQHQIFMSWLTDIGISVDLPIVIRSFRHEVNPYGCDVVTTGSNLVFFLFFMCFLYPFLNLIQRFGYERENHIFVHHLKFGIEYHHHWIAHFIAAFLHFSVLILIVFLFGMIHWSNDDFTYNFGNNTLLFVPFLLFYIIALILTTMALVYIVPVVTNAMLLGGLLWIVTYGMFAIILYHTESLATFWVNLAFLLFFNNTFAFGMIYLKNYRAEVKGSEVYILYGALLANMLIHLILLWHFQYFWPGRYVLRGPYNFLNLRTICSRKKEQQLQASLSQASRITLLLGLTWANVENVPIDSYELVVLKNVSTYTDIQKKQMHLKNLSMKVYRGEVTMILGHNGCGKTTLLSIMAGRYKPQNGDVMLKGINIYKYWHETRQYFDVCMPESALFDKLNATETLRYYFEIKNKKINSTEMEANKWLKYLKEIISDSEMLVHKMTFDQKRLLFLCCSLSCDTEVLLLDEPTQQMRWRESNLYWHILHKEKPNRAIIVTSNSIDMTDRYADRILIMHDGMSLAYGTKFFLKTTFGLAYRLIILKDPSTPITPITKRINKYIKGVKPEDILGDQVFYKLSKDKIADFQRLLIHLENNASELGIKSITLFGSELLDVYMNLGMQMNKQVIKDETLKRQDINFLKDKDLNRQQQYAMAYKKILYQAPSVVPLVMMFIVFILIMAINRMSKVLKVPPKEDITLKLGLNSNDSGRFLEPLVNCKTIVLDHVGTTTDNNRVISKVFDTKSIYCVERKKYMEFVTEDKYIHYTYGGVERDDKLGYTIWFNQRIFHSAPLALNLLHNLILSRSQSETNTATKDSRGKDPGSNKTKRDAKIYKLTVKVAKTNSIAENDPRIDSNNKSTGKHVEADKSTVNSAIKDSTLKDVAGENKYKTYLINNPMPIPLKTKVNLLEMQFHHLVLPLSVGIIMPITVSSFIIQLIEERETHFLMLMRLAGLKLQTYWFMTYLWDELTFLAYCIFYMVVMTFSSIDGFHMNDKFVILLLFLIYGLSAIPMTYFISLFCYGSRLSAYLKSCIVHVLTGLFFYIIYWDVIDDANWFYSIAMIFPSFALLDGLSNMYTEIKQEQYCIHTCENIIGCTTERMCELIQYCCFDTYFKWTNPGILPSIVSFIFSAFIFIGLIFWVELYRDENRFATTKNLNYYRSACYPYDDPDVVAVKKRIAETELRDVKRNRFVVDQLECEIPKDRRSLHTVSFEVKKGECLAIWAPRRSGKTHLVRQLIGEHSFCFGDIYVKGTEMKYEPSLAYCKIGYCPQDRGLFTNLSPRDLLQIFCMIRGIPEEQMTEFIDAIKKALNMRSFMNIKFNNLSYDMRSKTLVAIALLVNNEVIILDEPTRGLSALSRGQIYNVLRHARFFGKTLIFTTVGTPECHFMADECILFEDGEMLAIGSMQYLRQKYAPGFYLEVKLLLDGLDTNEALSNLHKDIENLHRFVTYIHEESELRSQCGNVLRYYCPVKNVIFSTLYGTLEKNRRRLNILSYIVTQGSIDDAFATVAATRLHKQKLYSACTLK